MKYSQRLDHGRLAEVLHERQLADFDAIRELLQLSQEGGMPFCEALVTSNLVADWELSKVVCEIFSLPFLPVDLATPNPKVLDEIDTALFRRHQLIPLDLFGEVLTVIMPALVSAEALAEVGAMTDCTIIPLVGTVESNRRWCNDHLAAAPAPDVEGGWESMFDAADAQVNAGDGEEGGMAEGLGLLDDPAAALPTEAEATEDIEGIEIEGGLDLDAGDLDLGAIEPLEENEVDHGDEPKPAMPSDGSALPPMPEFNPDQQ